MEKLHGREYWDLQETARYLSIDEFLVLEHLAHEALIKYKGQAISNEYLNAEGDFDDVALIRWIDGFFWLPVDIYIELEDLLLGDLEPLSFQSLMPQFIEITIKDSEKISFDGDARCNPASEDWTVIRRYSPYDIVIDKNTIIYFWSNTVEDFAEKNGFNAPLADNMLPTDVILKELENDLATITTETKEKKYPVPKHQPEAMNILLDAIEQCAKSKSIARYRGKMLGLKERDVVLKELTVDSKTNPKGKMAQQTDYIVATVKEMKIDPKNLPDRPDDEQGLNGLRSEVWGICDKEKPTFFNKKAQKLIPLFSKKGIFDTAWSRALSNQDLIRPTK